MPETGGEIYEVLGVYNANPLTTTKYAPVRWEEGDNEIRVPTSASQVWVEYLVAPTDLMSVAAADLDATEIPERFAGVLAYRAAAQLLLADGDAALSGALLGLAEDALRAEVVRLRTPRRWLVARS